MEIVEAIRERDGARVSELAQELDLAKSTVHGYLSTFEEEGYLIKEDGEYQVGNLFLRLGAYARNRRPEYRMAAKKVEELADQSEERAQFGIMEQGRVVFLYRRGGTHAVNTGTELGRRRYLHTSSIGKTILAHLPEEEIRSIVASCGLPGVTENTIIDEDELMDELDLIRERGYSINKEENIEGLAAVGAPITTDDEVIGGVSVSGPSHRLRDERLHGELADLVRGEANELELNIKYS
jgi:DNA-binding IclR family transcriptional regulator